MNGGTQGSGMSWTARLLVGLVLLLVGAAADEPTDDAMLALAAELCNKPQP
jgi:hypothetical protein